MTEGIVEALEVVEVNKENRYRMVLADGALHFPLQGFFHETTIEEPGQRIADGLVPQGFAKPQAGQRKGDLSRDRGASRVEQSSILPEPGSVRDVAALPNSRCRMPSMSPCPTMGTHKHLLLGVEVRCAQLMPPANSFQ